MDAPYDARLSELQRRLKDDGIDGALFTDPAAVDFESPQASGPRGGGESGGPFVPDLVEVKLELGQLVQRFTGRRQRDRRVAGLLEEEDLDVAHVGEVVDDQDSKSATS